MRKLEFLQDKLYVFYILIGIFIFIIFLIYIWNLTVDDAYISFRYALHLAEGYGLIWNIGEPPVEGYSNFLWVLIFSVILYLKLDPVVLSKLIGLASVIGILFYYFKFTEDIFSKKRKNVLLGFGIAVIFFLANPATAIHTISGLETMFYSFLIIALAYYFYKIISTPKNRYYWLLGVFALLLSLLRFEGILIIISLLLSMILINYKEHKSFKLERGFIIPLVSLFVFPVALYMILRYQYFHDFFPITYYAKSSSGTIFSTAIYNINWVYKYTLKHILPFILVNLLVIIFYKLFLSDTLIRRRYFKIIIIFIFIVIAGNIVYLSTELTMNYGDRLFYPSYITVYLITAISLTLIYINKDLYDFNPLKKFGHSRELLLIGLTVILIFTNLGFMSSLTGWHDYGNKVYNTQVSVGLALEPFSTYNYTVATDYAGAIPYYSRWRHIDMLGLNDKYIASNKKPSLNYLRQVKPDLIILPYKTNGELINEDFKPFLEYAEENNYTKIELPWDNFTYYLNPKVEHFNEINQSLGKVKYKKIMYDLNIFLCKSY